MAVFCQKSYIRAHWKSDYVFFPVACHTGYYRMKYRSQPAWNFYEVLVPLGCDAMSLGEQFVTFEGIAVL